MPRFYVANIVGVTCTLPPEESRHCIKVLRMKAGDTLELTDGQGNLFKAAIEEASANNCRLALLESHKEPPPGWELHIAVAPTKNIARIEWLVEKLTETGLSAFIPFTADHSERRIIKTDRLKKICIEAMKQSGRLYQPAVNELISFREVLDSYKDFNGQKFILHCNGAELATLHKSYIKGRNVLVLIGPEGDFSAAEVTKAVSQGFIPATLGAVRYRTETAALLAACTLHVLNQ